MACKFIGAYDALLFTPNVEWTTALGLVFETVKHTIAKREDFILPNDQPA